MSRLHGLGLQLASWDGGLILSYVWGVYLEAMAPFSTMFGSGWGDTLAPVSRKAKERLLSPDAVQEGGIGVYFQDAGVTWEVALYRELPQQLPD